MKVHHRFGTCELYSVWDKHYFGCNGKLFKVEEKILKEVLSKIQNISPQESSLFLIEQTNNGVFKKIEYDTVPTKKLFNVEQLTHDETRNSCIKQLVNLIKTHAKVDRWAINTENNTLIIQLVEQAGVYDIDIYNQFLEEIKKESYLCKKVFENDATFYQQEINYRTIYIKLTNKNK